MFAEIPERKNKARWLEIREGNPVLFQLLNDKSEKFYVHTIKTSDGRWLKIPHQETSKLMQEDYFNKQYPGSWVYRTNVLDVTPYVITSTGTRYSTLGRPLPERDPVTGENLRVLPKQPLNEVKILERGITLFKQFNSVIEAAMVENPNLDFKMLVLQLQVSGSGRNMAITIFPRMDVKPSSIEGVELFDLELPTYTDEEISQLMRGTPVSDIYAARRNNADSDGRLDFTAELPGL